MPFGGAGPLHGVALAEAVYARDVIVPVAPGITAAVGLLKTDLQYEFTEAAIVELTKAGGREFEKINAAVTSLKERAAAALDEDGIAKAEQQFELIGECRYAGQGFELRAAIPDGPVTADNVSVIVNSFHEQHHVDYGYSYRDAEVELITIRVIGRAAVKRIDIPEIEKTDGSSVDRALMFIRTTTFDDGRVLETPRYDRKKLFAGDKVNGPAILVQKDATTLVPPGYVAEMLNYGNTRVRAAGTVDGGRKHNADHRKDFEIHASGNPGGRSHHPPGHSRLVRDDRRRDGPRPVPDVVFVDHPRVQDLGAGLFDIDFNTLCESN